jgi:DNA-directed RNA polymerase subunit RPC12/RpoP/transcriptional regulator with XRE-family HTH domain
MVKEIKGNEVRNILCFKCAEIFSATNSRNYTCPSCGFKITSIKYSKIVNRAYSAVYFGYLYRLEYEKQISKKGEVVEHYQMAPPPELLLFIGVAALSGVIGNLTYDLLKNAIQWIIKSWCSRHRSPSAHKYEKWSNADLELFVKYIAEYHYEKIPAEIDGLIKKEQIICAISTGIIRHARENENWDRSSIAKAMKEAMERLNRQNRLYEKDFSCFWKEIKEKNK